jgi:hypothetical protein
MVSGDERECTQRSTRRCVVAHPSLPAFCVIGDRPLVSGTWRVESVGIHHRNGRALWLAYDATEVQIIRWLGAGSPELALALFRQGFRPWRSFAGWPLWIQALGSRRRGTVPSDRSDHAEGVSVGVVD